MEHSPLTLSPTEELGLKLRDLRLSKGLSLRAMASEIGTVMNNQQLSDTRIHKLEKGKVVNVAPRMLQAYADYFGIDKQDLYDILGY